MARQSLNLIKNKKSKLIDNSKSVAESKNYDEHISLLSDDGEMVYGASYSTWELYKAAIDEQYNIMKTAQLNITAAEGKLSYWIDVFNEAVRTGDEAKFEQAKTQIETIDRLISGYESLYNSAAQLGSVLSNELFSEYGYSYAPWNDPKVYPPKSGTPAGENGSSSDEQIYNQDLQINDAMNSLGEEAGVTIDASTGEYNNQVEIRGDYDQLIEQAKAAVSWDPRLYRVDAYVSPDEFLVPFAADSASSAYFDEVFTMESAIIKNYPSKKKSGDDATAAQSGNAGLTLPPSEISGDLNGADRVAPNKADVARLSADGNMYGTTSLMNPYCVTRLMGGLTGTKGDFSTHMYDIRDNKRFYDNAGAEGGGIVTELAGDYTSINNPTTTNIIRWSNKDKWGRTPYSFQDFVFCKYWKIIPNNRLITFRKYAVPTYDNLNFPNMLKEDGTTSSKIQVAPIATVVTYFGGDSANKLNDFLKFTTGTKWKDINADVHKVSGDTGSNPRAVIDSMFESGNGFGGLGSGSNIVNSFLSKMGGLTQQYLSFGKFVGLLDKDGYSGHSQEAWENLTSANVDPSEQLYSNKIVGPVNRIQSVKARDAGIEFGQSFSLTCEYVARPIGGVNTKAAMLDILSNCMEMASADAVFWGGGYRFMIKPHMYPFKRGAGSSRIMDDLYAGRIFGTNGAIAHGLEGLLNFGKKDANSSFEWSTVTERLGDVLSQTVGAIGNMLQSISSTLFGEGSTLSSWLKGATDAVSSEDQQKKGTEKLNAMFGNINKMWKDKVIKETTMPNIDGMKAILSGEPTGNWHMTVGNPLNPIMVVGNLICTKMDVSFSEELGPDDFPIEMKVVYTIEHAMARDKAAIQSMFNRGAGKIYKLPDYIKAISDYESKVDPFTGTDLTKRVDVNSFYVPKFMNASALMSQGGASGYQRYKITKGTTPSNYGDAKTTMIAKFMPFDPDVATNIRQNMFLDDSDNRGAYRANFFARKRNDN